MTKLTDTQSILLSTAAQREDRGLLPPPAVLGAISDRMRKGIAPLIERGLAREMEAPEAAHVWREEGDQRFRAVITDAGLVAIGIEPVVTESAGAVSPEEEVASYPPPSTAPDTGPRTKGALLLNLLRREQGATLTELVEATGWLPHTTRAALTGLRKKGHAISKSRRDDATSYQIGGEA